MRYFLRLAYKGTNYAGWQRQPNAMTVQEKIETAMSTILGQSIEITGCGRTDAGVHARHYIAHFDVANALPSGFVRSINSVLPKDIAIYEALPVSDRAHARFDARLRAYEYHISVVKDPFQPNTCWNYPQASQIEIGQLQAVADLLMKYTEFRPFCKSDSGLDTFTCYLSEARWEWLPEQQKWVFHIAANRFLRGMVRLIVGACMQVAQQKISLQDVQLAMDTQNPVPKSLSVPPEGLFLTKVEF
jgi:tRNA pseudouridine38-40 synthase